MHRSLALLLLMAACAPAPQEMPAPSVPDPAALYCLKQGGTVIDKDGATDAAGWCRLPSGLVVDGWDFYHQMNP